MMTILRMLARFMAMMAWVVQVARREGGEVGSGAEKGLSLTRRALRVLIRAVGGSEGVVASMAAVRSAGERGVPGLVNFWFGLDWVLGGMEWDGCGVVSGVDVPLTMVNPGLGGRAFGSLARAVTVWPLLRASSTTRVPVRPVAPMTRRRIVGFLESV